MRIAYVVPRFAPHIGGVETHVAALAGHVARAGHKIEVLTPEARPDLPVVESNHGILVRRFPLALRSTRFPVAPGLFGYLREHAAQYDLIHAHSYHALPALAAALTPGPIVFTPHYHGTGHTTLARALHRPYRAVGRRIFARSGRIICVSPSEAELVRRHFPGATDRITVIPNGVRSEPLRDARPFDSDRTVVLSVGRLERYKQVDALVEAMAHLDDAYRLIVVGEGAERARLDALARHLGAESRISFLGRLDETELLRWYRTATVCVSMSTHEAYGLTLMEACIAGAAVIASDIPAHRDVAAVLGDTARLLPPDVRPDKLAAAIRRASMARPDEVSPTSVLEWDDVAARTLGLYNDVVTTASVRTAPRGHHAVT